MLVSFVGQVVVPDMYIIVLDQKVGRSAGAESVNTRFLIQKHTVYEVR
jgi:hypothetical protein